jgi:anti-sigma factor RsiW
MTDAWTAKLEPYLDGELSSQEMRDLDAHLRTCPDCASEVLHRVQLKRSLQSTGRRFSPSPEFRQRVHRQIAAHPRTSPWKIWSTAAAVFATLLLAGLLFHYYGRLNQERNQTYSELADLHVATLASANPVDVVSTDRHTVKPWFQGKLPFTFNLPELQNSDFTLVGGRVAYLGQAPGAHLIYQIRKHQISVFILQERALDLALSLPSRGDKAQSFNLETWNQSGLRYFVLGDANSDDIHKLADLLKTAEH